MASLMLWLTSHIRVKHMKIAVAVYCVVIGSMAHNSFHQKVKTGEVNGMAARWSSLGALIFVVSDFSLAVNKFVMPLKPYAGFLVMSTYVSL